MFASADRVELSALWDELVAGTSKITGWSHEPDTWSLIVARGQAVAGSGPLRARDQEILEHTLLCGVRKIVAVEAGLSCSSIAVIMQSCFQFMGLDCLPSRIPGLLVAAAHARHRSSGPGRSAAKAARERAPSIQSIRVPRPDGALGSWLAPAEHAVIALLIEGQTYSEIAQARKTSIRTVANQIASGFRRLGVSGRAELLCMLSRWGFEAPEPPARRPSGAAPPSARRGRAKAKAKSLGTADEAQPPHPPSPSPAT